MNYTSVKLNGNAITKGTIPTAGILLANNIILNGCSWVGNICTAYNAGNNQAVYWSSQICGIVKGNNVKFLLGKRIAVKDGNMMVFGTIVECFIHGTDVEGLCNNFYNVNPNPIALGLGPHISYANAIATIASALGGNPSQLRTTPTVGYILNIEGFMYCDDRTITTTNPHFNQALWAPFLENALNKGANSFGVGI